MLKELILAIIIGSLLGIGLTGGYLALNKDNNSPNNDTEIVASPTAISKKTNSQENNQKNNLIIASPEDYDIVSKEKLEISGTTNSNSTIILTLGDQILSEDSNDKGNFKFEISLNSGLNIIKIVAIDSQDNQFEETLNITYSTAKI